MADLPQKPKGTKEPRQTKGAKPVGAGDIGVLVENVRCLIEDVRGGNYSEAWTHAWSIMDEIRFAMSGGGGMRSTASSVPCPAVQGVKVDENKKEEAIAICFQMEQV